MYINMCQKNKNGVALTGHQILPGKDFHRILIILFLMYGQNQNCQYYVYDFPIELSYWVLYQL